MSDQSFPQISLVDRTEALYLRLLRWIAIIVATILLVAAAWSGVASLVNYIASMQSVSIQPVQVSEAEMVSAATPPPSSKSAQQSPANEATRIPTPIYDGHARKMYEVWKSEFEPFRPKGDERLSFEDFSQWYQTEYINGTLQKHDVVDWLGDSDRVKDDLDASVEALAQAGREPAIVSRMQAFQAGKSQKSYWDRYDQVFMRLTDAFWVTLKEKREAEIARAQARREDSARRAEAADAGFVQARNALVGFLALMFFFLIVAMERHQRRIAAELTAIKFGTGQPE